MKILIFNLISLVIGYLQNDEILYLNNWSNMTKYSTTFNKCKTSNPTEASNMNQVILPKGKLNAKFVQKLCNPRSLCIIPKNSIVSLNSNLNVGALVVKGKLIWSDLTQNKYKQYLCTGYILVQDNGEFNINLKYSNALIYIKNNGAKHDSILYKRFIGGINTNNQSYPIISINGRKLERTWSLLSDPITTNTNQIKLIHDPKKMGWFIGDRLVIAPIAPLSQGTAISGNIVKIMNNIIYLSKNISNLLPVNFNLSPTGTLALQSPEVINLSRNIIITGDDFTHENCDPNLNSGFTPLGCSCNPTISRSKCTIGLHTIMNGFGLLQIEYTRIEKCGQRGIQGKYCLHFHYMNQCPKCRFIGNAIESSQQRGIIIHETHLTQVEYNVLNDVRGAGIYIEDGNEMQNKINYNVVICPNNLNNFGCSIPGTDNDQADTSLNQAGLWSSTPANNVVGNRFSNSFNGMFYDLGKSNGAAENKVNTLFMIMGKLEGNTFHGHGRFGTYILFYFPKNGCIGNINNNGFLSEPCTAFTNDGLNNGISLAHINNVDYSNAFVGGYNINDLQYRGHVGINNLNNIYWKETNNFADLCSAHISNSYYNNGNIALPDMAGMIIENTIFTGNVQLETNHHCNDGITGFLCMPTYILDNVTWYSTATRWVEFHQEANNYGGIIVSALNQYSNFFPKSYCSLVSFYWTYLLEFGCISSTTLGNQISEFYSNGILCNCDIKIRSLKIYSRDQLLSNHIDLNLEIYEKNKLITKFIIPYHQIGADYSDTNKQGYAFPVISGMKYTYKITTNISKDWIIEFSELIFGNKWIPDLLLLNVTNRNCGLITSQHDRRFILADSNDYLELKSVGRGACTLYEDMPFLPCNKIIKTIKTKNIDSCLGIKCYRGSCINQYLGGQLQPTSNSCICDQGWSGPTCNSNPCKDITCSNNGYCIAINENDFKCICNSNYSGKLCNQSCNNFGCATDYYPYSCASISNMQTVCLKGSGCYYSNTWFETGNNACCYANCDKCDLISCPKPINDCYIAGSCNNGICSNQTIRADGSECNNIPFGKCIKGQCIK